MQQSVSAGEANRLIEEKGLKRTHVAGKIGVNPGTLSRFLNGKCKLGKSAMILLCQVLDVEDRAS
jgi:transcriptional regulator with XRE-family HTH domain